MKSNFLPILLIGIVSLTGCKKPDAATLPILSTASATNITSTTATSGGNISSDGNAAVTSRGVCWSTSANPTISESHTSDGTGNGSFNSNLTGLSSTTLYHARAYATNSVGTAYGNDVAFTTIAPQPANEVYIQGMAFSPLTLTVTKNTTIKWTNKDDMSHTVTSDTGLFSSGTLTLNGTFSFQFTAAGTYHYHCSFHSGMTGTIIVQ